MPCPRIEDVFLKSRVREICKHGSVRGIKQPKEVVEDVYSTIKRLKYLRIIFHKSIQ